MFINLIINIVKSDPYHDQGTTYLHVADNRGVGVDGGENPTGAVVVPISMSTTFRQSVPGQATAAHDPNSFGMGYEYSRTGMFMFGLVCVMIQYFILISFLILVSIIFHRSPETRQPNSWSV